MSNQKTQSQTQLLDLLVEIVKQNSQVIQQNNQLINQVAVQSSQISELLLMLEEQEEVNEHRYLDE